MTGQFRTAVAVEARKLVASHVVRAATLLIVVGIATLTASLAAAAGTGDEQILAKLGDLADEEGWALLVGIAIQITSAAGLLGFGVVMAFVVGREFTDGTISGLFALPISRGTIAAAKVAVVLVWTAVVAICLTGTIVAVGVGGGHGMPDADDVDGLARLFVLTVMSGAVAVPAAWAATLGRGLLPGIAVTIGIIASAQILVVAGAGGWYPAATPALWAIDPANVSIAQLGFVFVVAGIFTIGTVHSWVRLQLDR
ncbi:MAG: ABC transporter permease [Ilumatobacteraceae bacterium]